MRVNLHQYVTYWAPTGVDRNGKQTYANPVEYRCRWDDVATQTIGPEGNPTMSAASVILMEDVTTGGLMFEGRLADAPTAAPLRISARVREIINKVRNPSLKATYKITTAMLR